MLCCPLCTYPSYIPSPVAISQSGQKKHITNVRACTFKTVESVDKILCQPIQAQPVDENALPPPDKRTLNRYRRYNSNPTLH